MIVCDDDALVRWSMVEHLREEGYDVVAVEDGERCLAAVEAGAPHGLVLDLKMPGMDGLTCLQRLRESGHDFPVIVVTAHGGIESAIEATRLGASDYLTKPFDLRELSLSLERTLRVRQLASELAYLRGKRTDRYGKMVGNSAQMRRVFETLEHLEDVDGPTVLLTGESGTGKDLVAQAIHRRGPRADQPFVEVDCASLPGTLIESTLFGHERGAFTDAKQSKPGLFEVAREGTIFLDEVGEMSPSMQARLLRALENRRFKRVGGVVDLPMNAAVIAATNRDLLEEVAAERFRSDLYYRLAVLPIHMPPLRARPEDIPVLFSHLLETIQRRVRSQITGISPDALARMMAYGWPGNVRELANVIERICILNRDLVTIELAHLPSEIAFSVLASVPHAGGIIELPADGIDLLEVERTLLTQALERTDGNQTAAARLLGLTRYALRYRMGKHSLDVDDVTKA
ncbi:MAG: two-component system response regulator AtoC [Myxococcota bacterium]